MESTASHRHPGGGRHRQKDHHNSPQNHYIFPVNSRVFPVYPYQKSAHGSSGRLDYGHSKTGRPAGAFLIGIVGGRVFAMSISSVYESRNGLSREQDVYKNRSNYIRLDKRYIYDIVALWNIKRCLLSLKSAGRKYTATTRPVFPIPSFRENIT